MKKEANELDNKLESNRSARKEVEENNLEEYDSVEDWWESMNESEKKLQVQGDRDAEEEADLKLKEASKKVPLERLETAEEIKAWFEDEELDYE